MSATLCAAGLGLALAAPATASRAPNVIVVMTDDQSEAMFTPEVMPRTFRLLADRGTRFFNSVVTTSLCCPSRVALLTGQYGHNNGVLHNSYGPLRDKRNVLSTWLDRAGYRTMHVGRFLNGYEGRGRERQVAPGWNVWRTALAPRGYYDYALTTNRDRLELGSADEDHLTEVLNQVSAQLVRRWAPRRKPFYLQVDHFAPHWGPGDRTGRCPGGPVPAPADEWAFAEAPLPRPASFNEADLSDKPDFIQALPTLDREQVAALEGFWRCALASLRSVDRGVGELWRALGDAGARRDTVIIFSSDNGYLLGEHRIGSPRGQVAGEKAYPYEGSIRVPLAIRIPKRLSGGRPQRGRSARPVANIDLAPTILQLTGAEPCRRDRCRKLDGRSLVGELRRGGNRVPADRPIVLELDGRRPGHGLTCTYSGVRVGRAEVLVRHTRARTDPSRACVEGEWIEHYQLDADPAQLENRYPAPVGSADAQRQEGLMDLLDRLSGCAGIKGRDRPPRNGVHCR